MTLTITIDLDRNANLADDRDGEVARILSKLIDKVESGALDQYRTRTLRDTNGNAVGSWHVTE